MSKFINNACKLGKYLAPAGIGGALLGIGKICETNYKASKEKPKVRDNYSRMNIKIVGTLTVAAAALIVVWNVCDSVKHSENTKADAELEAVKATFGRRRNGSDSEGDDNPTVGDPSSNDNEIKAQKASDIKGSYENYNDGQLLGKLIYKGDTVIWYGTPGSGKTTAAIQMAIDLSLGSHSKLIPAIYDNGLHKPIHIIYYDMEMDDNDFDNFFGTYDRSQIPNIDFFRNTYFTKPTDFVNNVRSKLSTCKDDTVVFVDNASAIGLTLNAEGIRSLFLNDFRKMKEECKARGFTVTFIVIAHTNKEQKLYGSSNFSNFCSTMLKMERVPNKNSSTLSVEKSRKYGTDMQDKKFMLEFDTIDGHKGFENKGEIKMGNRETTEKDSLNDEPKFDTYTLSQVQELYELSQKQKPNPKGEGTVPYSSRDIAEAASFKVSHTKVCDLIRQYKEFLSEEYSESEQESSEYPSFVEIK